MQLDPITPALKAPGAGAKHLKLEYDNLLSTLAFNIDLRRYIVGGNLDMTAVAAAEEANGMLPHAANITPPAPPEAPAPALEESVIGSRRHLLGKKGKGAKPGKAAAAGAAAPGAGYLIAAGVGEKTLAFALAAAETMENENLPGISRLFEGLPEAYVRLVRPDGARHVIAWHSIQETRV